MYNVYVYNTSMMLIYVCNSQHGADPVQMAQLHKNYRVLNLLIEKYDCKIVFVPDIMEVHICTYMYFHMYAYV